MALPQPSPEAPVSTKLKAFLVRFRYRFAQLRPSLEFARKNPQWVTSGVLAFLVSLKTAGLNIPVVESQVEAVVAVALAVVNVILWLWSVFQTPPA